MPIRWRFGIRRTVGTCFPSVWTGSSRTGGLSSTGQAGQSVWVSPQTGATGVHVLCQVAVEGGEGQGATANGQANKPAFLTLTAESSSIDAKFRNFTIGDNKVPANSSGIHRSPRTPRTTICR